MVPALLVRNLPCPTHLPFEYHSYTTHLLLHRPLQDELTLSILSRAKQSGYSALVVTVDTMAVGWRPMDIDSGFRPFRHSIGCQVGLSDPVFMRTQGLEPLVDDEGVPAFPYDPRALDELYRSGDAKTTRLMDLADKWNAQALNGVFRSWEDVRFLRKNWDGPLILKGILSVEVRR